MLEAEPVLAQAVTQTALSMALTQLRSGLKTFPRKKRLNSVSLSGRTLPDCAHPNDTRHLSNIPCGLHARGYVCRRLQGRDELRLTTNDGVPDKAK